MRLDQFKASLAEALPPEGLPASLCALWHAARGNWDQAHELVQDSECGNGAWVHAHLHRREGDNSNARYWYRSAGKQPCTAALEEEWEQICRELLAAERL